MNKFLIDIQDAVVTYREDVALQGVSLQVQCGEFVGVIGPNGAGKTTLLTVINGLGRLEAGRARVLGIEPHRGQGHRLRKRIGYVAQVEPIDPRLPITVAETVLTGCYGRLGWLRKPHTAERGRAEEALASVGVAHLRNRPIGHLSGGEYQRVAIARALVQDPVLFLFDEPTASIDPRAQRDILDLIQRIHAERGTTALYVTHDLANIPAACDRLVLMKDGGIWREGPRDAMLDPTLLHALYGGLEPSMPVAAVGEGG